MVTIQLHNFLIPSGSADVDVETEISITKYLTSNLYQTVILIILTVILI